MAAYRDNLFARRKDEAVIAHAVIKAIQDDHAAGRTADDPFLTGAVAELVVRVAAKYLERKCHSDNDTVFYATETVVEANVLKFIDSAITIKEASYAGA